MPIIRKLIRLKTSKAVCLPKSWIQYFERETGAEITEVAIEVNRELRISPILPKAEPKAEGDNKDDDFKGP